MNYCKPALFLCFLLSLVNGKTQSASDRDSLQRILRSPVHDSVKLHQIQEWDDRIYLSDPELDAYLNQQIIHLCESGLSRNKLRLSEKRFYRTKLANGLNNTGMLLAEKGDYIHALEKYSRCMQLREELRDIKGQSFIWGNIANIHYELKDYNKALHDYNRSLRLSEKIGDERSAGTTYSNMANIYAERKQDNKALAYYEKALQKGKKSKHDVLIARVLNNIGIIYRDKKKYDQALQYFQSALVIRQTLDDLQGTASSLNGMGMTYAYMNRIEEAIAVLEQAAQKAREAGSAIELREACKVLAKCYRKKEMFKEAFEMQDLYIQMKDSVENEQNLRASVRQEYRFLYAKKTASDSTRRTQERKLILARMAANDAQLKQEKIQRYALFSVLAVIALFSLFLFNRFRVTSRQKQMIEIKEKETHLQKALIESKQKEIIDSIQYAQRIQQTILPSTEEWNQLLPDSFVLYRPKDIVAGDFYWLEQISEKSGGLQSTSVYVAAADCTGHGVPGALVSVVCSNALNRAVLEMRLTKPGEILDKTREIVTEQFVRSGRSMNDGMDIALIRLDFRDKRIQSVSYAGANNPLWIISVNTCTEIKPDKQPIGKHDHQQPFTTHNIALRGGETLYIFTDGFQDQFGGPDVSKGGKKFKASRLQACLLSAQSQSMNEQKATLNKVLNQWMGDLEQIDDVCLIGIKV